MLFSAFLKTDLLEALEDDDATALLVVMRWAVLLHKLQDAWWIGPAGRSLVSKISHLLLAHLRGRDEEGRKTSLFAWLRQQVELEPAISGT